MDQESIENRAAGNLSIALLAGVAVATLAAALLLRRRLAPPPGYIPTVSGPTMLGATSIDWTVNGADYSSDTLNMGAYTDEGCTSEWKQAATAPVATVPDPAKPPGSNHVYPMRTTIEALPDSKVLYFKPYSTNGGPGPVVKIAF